MGDQEDVLTPGPPVGQPVLEEQHSLATPPPRTETNVNGNYSTLVVDTSSQGSPGQLSSASADSANQRYQDGKVFIGGEMASTRL